MPALPVSLLRWHATDFAHFERSGVAVDPAVGARLEPGLLAGTLSGPETPASSPFTEAIASWQARTPPGTEIEVLLRAEIDGRWTRWWTMGHWSSAQSRRHSVDNQHDLDGRVDTDTLRLHRPAKRLQWRLLLRSVSPDQSPLVWAVAAMCWPVEARALPSVSLPAPALPVPELSQQQTPGGEDWCSAVSLTMVLQYWYAQTGAQELSPFAAADATERLTAPGVHDPRWGGTGNWPFNTAYAASLGLEAYVARLASLNELAQWTAAGVPVIASISFGRGELNNTPSGFEQSSGHLLVVAGFTEQGDVVANDPRADPALGERVRRIYARDQFERIWQRGPRGTVYLIYPRGWG